MVNMPCTLYSQLVLGGWGWGASLPLLFGRCCSCWVGTAIGVPTSGFVAWEEEESKMSRSACGLCFVSDADGGCACCHVVQGGTLISPVAQAPKKNKKIKKILVPGLGVGHPLSFLSFVYAPGCRIVNRFSPYHGLGHSRGRSDGTEHDEFV